MSRSFLAFSRANGCNSQSPESDHVILKESHSMKIKSAGAFSTLAFLLSSSCGLISTKASAQFLLNLSPGVASVVQGGSQNFTAQLTMGVSAPETYNLVSVA